MTNFPRNLAIVSGSVLNQSNPAGNSGARTVPAYLLGMVVILWDSFHLVGARVPLRNVHDLFLRGCANSDRMHGRACWRPIHGFVAGRIGQSIPRWVNVPCFAL